MNKINRFSIRSFFGLKFCPRCKAVQIDEDEWICDKCKRAVQDW